MRQKFAALVLVCALLLWPPVLAGETNLVPADQIVEQLTTRDIGLAIKVTAEGYVVPEAAQHLSLTTIYFDLDSDTLRAPSESQLNELVKAINNPALRDSRFLIEGHTCNLGTPQHNMTLSEKRAGAVRQFLIRNGIHPARLETNGWGLTRPVAPNTDEAHRQLNRRVDFIKLESASMAPVIRGLRTPAIRGLDGNRFIKAEVIAQKKNAGPVFPLDKDVNELASGDMFQIRIQILEGCHLYVLMLTSQGEVQWLCPTEDTQYGRWCYFAENHVLPDQDMWYVLDDNKGTEMIAVIAAAGPLNNAANIPNITKQSGTAANPANLALALSAQEAQVQLTKIGHR